VSAVQAALDPGQWLYDKIVGSGFLGRYPQHAAVLARLTTVDDPTTEVMAVSSSGSRFYLHVQRAFFEDHARMLAGILLHEVHHIVLGHTSHPKFRGLAHPDLLDLAMEMSANEGIREPLPPHVSITDYAHLEVGPGQSTLERYELLVRARARGWALGKPPGFDEHSKWMPAVIRGDRDEAGGASAAELVRVFAAASCASDGKNRLLAGRDPGDLLAELNDVGARPIDWRAALRSFVTFRRQPGFDYCHPNRRFPLRLGEVPGRVRREARTKPAVIVAIDTSASMSEAELSEIAVQLDRLTTYASMFVVECDAAIQRTYPYEGGMHQVLGRGGTDLRPVFEPEVLHRFEARGVVYFTDGCGPFPLSSPPVPVLWVLTKGEGFGCPWGQRVVMRVSS
jgi:predicted metal-dependent peptidase